MWYSRIYGDFRMRNDTRILDKKAVTYDSDSIKNRDVIIIIIIIISSIRKDQRLEINKRKYSVIYGI